MDLWQDIRLRAGAVVLAAMHELVRASSADLANRFYDAMFADVDASALLDHKLVNERLRRSMKNWLESLFDSSRSTKELQALQSRTGEVHARVGVPMALVNRGARVLKRRLCEQVEQAPDLRRHAVLAVCYIHETIDLALDQINAAYVKNENRLTRAEEAFRHLYLSQNLQAERERQRSLLLEWSQGLLLNLYREGSQLAPVKRSLALSQFGLWLQHKAAVIFEGAPELQWIAERVADMEQRLLPALHASRGDAERSQLAIDDFNTGVEAIKHMLASLFDLVDGREAVQDSVTHLLHRRYLPSVIKREISQCQRGQSVFALLVAEVDQVEQVGIALGSEALEMVLAQVASLIAQSVRAGDFVFRLSESRFAIVIVEVEQAQAETIARALKDHVGASMVRAGSQARVQVTLSVGVANYDGHPDYERLITRAEEELARGRAS